MIIKLRKDWEKLDQIRKQVRGLEKYLEDKDILKFNDILSTLNSNIVEELNKRELIAYNGSLPILKVADILEIESDDVVYIEDMLISELKDYLKYDYFIDRNIILNNYLDYELTEIDRLGDITTYLSDISDYNDLINTTLNNILDTIEPIGYIDNIIIYDTINYNHDTYFLINKHGWETVIIDYNDNTFKLDDYTYKIDDIARL